MKYNKRFPIHFSPGADDFGGGGGSGADGTPNGGSEFADLSQYVPKSEFERVTGELGEFRNKYSTLEQDYTGFKQKFSGLFGEEKGGSKELKEPNFAEYKARGEQGVLDYIDARAQYLASKQFETLKSREREEAQRNQSMANLNAAYQKHIGRIPEAQKRYKDFDQVTANAAMPLPDGRNGQPNVLADVLDSEYSADIQYQLSKNPGDLFKLVSAYQENPAKGARLLGAYEARIESQRAAEKAAAAKGRVRPTIISEADAEGTPGEEQELDDIAREAYGVKRKG